MKPEIIDMIVKNLSLKEELILSNNISVIDLIEYLIGFESVDEIIISLGITRNKYYKLLTEFKNKCNIIKPNKGTRWYTLLLDAIDHKKCFCCLEIKHKNEFGNNSCRESKKKVYCKECDSLEHKLNKEKYNEYKRTHYNKNASYYSAKTIFRRLRLKRQTPNWAQKDLIFEFYKNKPEGYHVDHIVPLNGELVCGLHVIENLQYLTAQDNLEKSNKYQIE